MKSDHDPAFCVMTAAEVCRVLGFSRDTLYAYVSRGRLRSAVHPSDRRKSLYDRRDVQALAERKQRGRSRRAVAESTLNWGEPVLTSKITRIADGRYYYRGNDAVELSRTATLEETLALLAGVRVKAVKIPAGFTLPALKLPFDRVLSCLAAEAVASRTNDGRPRAAQLLRLGAMSAAGAAGAAGLANADAGLPTHELIGRSWSNSFAAPDLIRRALVLCADHELNASAYTARVAASAGASLPAALMAGMAALSGNRHGGLTSACRDWVVSMQGDLSPAWRAQYALDGKAAPGFGHPLYPDGDPRADELLDALPDARDWHRVARQVRDETGEHPTIDFGLALLERELRLPEGAGMGIFAAGRMAGWLAHVFEQRQTGQLIRPRAAVEDELGGDPVPGHGYKAPIAV